MSGFKKYAKNTGYLFLEKIARILVAIFVWALMARFLGVEKFGIFNFALSFVFLFGIISDLGLDHVVIRELVKGVYEQRKIIGTAFVMKLCGAVLAILIVVIVTGFLSMDVYTRSMIYILSLRLIFESFNVIDFYFQSQVLSKYTVYSQIIGLSVTTVLCLSFIHFKLPLIYFVCAVIIETAVTSGGLNIFYGMKHQKVSFWQFDSKICRKLFGDAWPMIVSGLAVAIYMRIDQIMVKEILGSSSVGYYAAAARASEAFYFVPAIVTASIFPAIVNAKQNDPLQYQNRVQLLFSILFWSALIMAVVGSLAAKPLIRVLYGEAFLPAAATLSIHIWASIFVFFGEARHKWAISENLQIFTMYYLILAALLNVGLNLLLIPRLGIQGAAIATVAAQFVANVLSNLLHEKTRPIFWVQMRSVNLIQALKNFALRG